MFEDYLKEVHGKHYQGTDDSMPDAFEKWIADLEIDEWLDLGNKALAEQKEIALGNARN